MILQILSGLDQIPEADLVETGTEDIQPGERVVGVLGLNMRRLYVVLNRQIDLVQAKQRELKETVLSTAPTPEAIGVMGAKSRELEADQERASLLKKIFWREAREEFNLNGQSVALRKGWKVVVSPESEPEHELNPFLDMLGGLVAELAGEAPDCGNPDCPVHGHKHGRMHPGFLVVRRTGQA